VADNRRSGVGIAERFTPQGYDVLAYDSRAHGQSGGEHCTYGFHERRDVSRALDAVGAAEAILFGSSMGGAVALQAAAVEPRIRGVIAQSAFADLGEVVRERARRFGPLVRASEVRAALRLAEQQASFRVDDVSPRTAAAAIRVPVLLVHGERDRETPADHSRRIYAALGGPRRLLVVPGAGHNDVLGRPEAWREIESWLASLTPSKGDVVGIRKVLPGRLSLPAVIATSRGLAR
jgi:pimeloyl-ACP methyl ester carboxylesterase